MTVPVEPIATMMLEVREYIAEEILQEGPTVIHCDASFNRTAAVVGALGMYLERSANE